MCVSNIKRLCIPIRSGPFKLSNSFSKPSIPVCSCIGLRTLACKKSGHCTRLVCQCTPNSNTIASAVSPSSSAFIPLIQVDPLITSILGHSFLTSAMLLFSRSQSAPRLIFALRSLCPSILIVSLILLNFFHKSITLCLPIFIMLRFVLYFNVTFSGLGILANTR